MPYLVLRLTPPPPKDALADVQNTVNIALPDKLNILIFTGGKIMSMQGKQLSPLFKKISVAELTLYPT